MTAQRSTNEENNYRKYLKNENDSSCPFCSIDINHPQYIEETKYFKIIKNKFPYSIWDGAKVKEHIMLVPIRHIGSLSQVNAGEANDFANILSQYEKQNYNFYGRTHSSNVKSVVHQHTHLLKLGERQHKFVLMLRKPIYIRVSLR